MINTEQLQPELVENMRKELENIDSTIDTRCAQIALDYAEREYIKGVLVGLKICKAMWAQGTMSHENIYENEVYYNELLKKHEDGSIL